MVLTVSFVVSPETGFLSPSSSETCSRNLIPASGYQDATTSPSARNAFVFRTESVHRIPHPTSVTIAKRPSVQERGTARFMDLIWAKGEGIYFCSNGWTGSINLIGFDKFAVWRKGALKSRRVSPYAAHPQARRIRGRRDGCYVARAIAGGCQVPSPGGKIEGASAFGQ
jgi:hypothetical protein